MKRQNKIFILAGSILAASAIAFRKLNAGHRKQEELLEMKSVEIPQETDDLRGKIYFEIFTAFRRFRRIRAGVYNTIRRIPFTLDAWDDLDTDKIKQELGAAAVIKNGPRLWALDAIRGYYRGGSYDFNGYILDLVAVIESEASQLSDRKNYTEHTIIRYTDFIFLKGKKIYELITDKEVIYTLQSVSHEINKDITVEDFDIVSDKLKLPAGWKFRTRVTDSDTVYKIRGEAHIIQDEFRNTYQRNP